MAHDEIMFMPEKMFKLEQRLDNMELILKRWEEDVLRHTMAIKSIENHLKIINDLNAGDHSAIEALINQIIGIKSQFLMLEKKIND